MMPHQAPYNYPISLDRVSDMEGVPANELDGYTASSGMILFAFLLILF
jgi:hypothetical protein